MADNELLENINKSLSQIIDLLKNLSLPSSSLQVVESTCKYTLFDWLDKWFLEFKAPTLKDKGYDTLNSINKHIKANIENKPLNQYDGVDIQEAINKIPSGRMGQIVHSIYNQCFNCALDLGFITKNPIAKVVRPKHDIEQGRALTIDEHKLFLYHAKDNELKPLFMFYLLTGCRKSEALSARWEDVTETTLTIRGTKTKNAFRTLPIYPQLKKLLDTIKSTSQSKYLFPYGNSKVIYAFEKIRSKLNFQDFTIHDLRHTFGTRCIESGISLKTIQKWLGHADYMTTANIYSHITTEFENEEITRLNKNVIALKSDRFRG